MACETLVTTGLVVIAGEITTKAQIDFSQVARETIREIGYTRAKYGFDCDTCAVLSALDRQSPDIAMGVDTGGAGDQGQGGKQPVAPEGDWSASMIDYNAKAERMGWLPSAPQLQLNPIELGRHLHETQADPVTVVVDVPGP